MKTTDSALIKKRLPPRFSIITSFVLIFLSILLSKYIIGMTSSTTPNIEIWNKTKHHVYILLGGVSWNDFKTNTISPLPQTPHILDLGPDHRLSLTLDNLTGYSELLAFLSLRPFLHPFINHNKNGSLVNSNAFLKKDGTGFQVFAFSTISSERTFYLTIKETDLGELTIVPQTGRLKGLAGKTETGYSLKHNVTADDCKSCNCTIP